MSVYLVKAPVDNTEPIQNITRLEQDVVNVLKQHYGPYYSEVEAITGCMWGPGPIPFYLQPVYNCTLGMPNGQHYHNNERCVHVAPNWLRNIPDRLVEAKEQYANTLTSCITRYQNSCYVNPSWYIIPTVNKNGNNYTFIFPINDKADNESLARLHLINLGMKWDVGEGSGYLVKKTKLYINGSLFRTKDHDALINKQTDYSYFRVDLIDLIDYKEKIVELRYEVEGELDTRSNLFQIDKLEERIRPFYRILKRESEKYFNDEISLEQCMLNLKHDYLALPAYGY